MTPRDFKSKFNAIRKSLVTTSDFWKDEESAQISSNFINLLFLGVITVRNEVLSISKEPESAVLGFKMEPYGRLERLDPFILSRTRTAKSWWNI